VLGVGVSCLTLDSAVEEVSGWVDRGEHRYVCVTGVHGVMESQRDPQLLRIHNRSGLTTPDGMPMVWSARWAGRREVSRVYGPDLMLAVLARAIERGWSSFFYGGGPAIAERLADRLITRFPGLQVAGTSTPPFRPAHPAGGRRDRPGHQRLRCAARVGRPEHTQAGALDGRARG